VPRRIDKGRCDSLFAKSFGGLQPVQTLNKHEARAGRYNGDHQSRDEELIFDADNFCCHLSMADVSSSACLLAKYCDDYLNSALHFFSTTRIVGASVKVFPVITL
jgi:hypothetical protein